MMKTILSFCAVYQSTFGQPQQQWIPIQLPGQVTQAPNNPPPPPQQPAATIPAQPAPPQSTLGGGGGATPFIPISLPPVNVNPGSPNNPPPPPPQQQPQAPPAVPVQPLTTLGPVLDPMSFPAGALYDISGAECVQQAGAVCGGNGLLRVASYGTNELQNAKVTVADPRPNFNLFCTGNGACQGASIDITIPYNGQCTGQVFRIGAIDCSGRDSCKGLDLTIRNMAPLGCGKVIIDELACTETGSCTMANFNFIGDVETANCDLGPSGHSATGLDKCYTGLAALLCQDPGSCQGIIKTLTNPIRAFKLECTSTNSCFGANINIILNSSPWYDPVTGTQIGEPVEFMDGFKFAGEASAAYGHINIDNNQRGASLEIDRVDCLAANACFGTTFVLGPNVDITEFVCLPGACSGCLVKQNIADPGKACSEYAPPRRR